MGKLNLVVKKYADALRHLGEEAKETESSNAKINALTNELKKVSSKNTVFFWISVSMVVIVFILSLVLIMKFLSDPGKVQTIFSISGVSVMGLIIYMTKLWKDKVNTDMLLILISTLDKEMINPILVSLINKL